MAMSTMFPKFSTKVEGETVIMEQRLLNKEQQEGQQECVSRNVLLPHQAAGRLADFNSFVSQGYPPLRIQTGYISRNNVYRSGFWKVNAPPLLEGGALFRSYSLLDSGNYWPLALAAHLATEAAMSSVVSTSCSMFHHAVRAFAQLAVTW